MVPWLGHPFKAGQQISDVVLGLTADVLQPSTAVGEAIAPDRVLQNGRIDVQLLRAKEPELSAIAERASRLDVQAQAIRDPDYVSSLQEARTQLQDQTSRLATLLENTALAAKVPGWMTCARRHRRR